MIAPVRTTGIMIHICLRLLRSSRAEATTELYPLATVEKQLVTLAITGERPIAKSDGYETSEARPAAALVIPARIPITINKTIETNSDIFLDLCF